MDVQREILMVLQWNLTDCFRTSRVGSRCSGSVSGKRISFCPNIRSDIVLFSKRFGIGVVSL